MRTRRMWPVKLALSAAALLVLVGCASVSSQQNQDRVNEEVSAFAGDRVQLSRTRGQQAEQAQAVQKLLAAPLAQPAAVQLALAGSPSVQALLAQGWSDAADAAQSGRMPNPIFSFGRLAGGDGLELDRALSFGLLDLLTLPARHGVATSRIEQAQLRLGAEVVDQVTRVRQAWVRAVAAQQA
ncbi:MAG: transporter, partial [Comamonas sp.]|nr:transporter [Comamonas sp.]